ncbi:MAG: DMT family transporter [Geobacteraceae bacterium]|nr:DMT family transporter [Geobacteraceae bacterium]
MLAALGSAASWSLGAVLFKGLGESLSSFAMTLVKGGVSVFLLGALTLLTGGYANIGGEAYLYLILSGILGIALSDTFFFSALKEVSPQTITLLFTFGQVVTVLLAVLLLGETLPLQGWGGIALIITGITIGMFPGFAEKGQSSLRGIVFGLISILLMSFSVILTKKGLAEVSTLYATFLRMLAGTLGMLLVGIATRRLGGWVTPFRDPRLMTRFTLSVCVITFGGFWLAIVAFKYTSVAVANSLISTEPIFVLPVAALLLKEKVTVHAVAGAVIATVGVIVLCTGGSGI